MTVAEIKKAIEQHDAWRRKLSAAIRTGALADGLGKPLSVEDVSRDDASRFDKWLRGDSPTGPRSMPDYKDVAALNAAFHKEAGRVLGLALAGKLQEAEAQTAVASRFGKLSAAIMVKLTCWTTLFEPASDQDTRPMAQGGYHSSSV